MLTPLDIQNKVFKKKAFGYSVQQVDEFLNLVIASYEAQYKENRLLNDRINTLGDTVKQYKTMEDTLQNTLVAAQTASEHIQTNASAHAENIVKSAENKSVEMMNTARQELHSLTHQHEALKSAMDLYRSKMTAILEAQLGLLKDVSDKTAPETKEQTAGAKIGLSEELFAALGTE
jgi:cell division initiation protein